MTQDNAGVNPGGARPPKAHITYEAEAEPLNEVVELPFVIGVMADLAGQSAPSSPPLEARKFVHIDQANFDAALAACRPRAAFVVENNLEGDGAPLQVELRFQSMADFGPEGVARQVPALLEALTAGCPQAPLQLDEILHAEAFQRLEATWRGLNYLLCEIETSPSLEVRVLSATKAELLADLMTSPSPNQSAVFRKVHDEPYGTFRGEPFAVLVGDYEFSNDAEDLELLEGMAYIAAAAHAPFIATAGPRMFGWTDFTMLSETRALSRIFEGAAYARWRSFRESGHAAYAALVMPRILLRLPYGDTTVAVKAFSYQETIAKEGCNRGLLWGNAAFALAVRLAEAFGIYHWCAAIVGLEGGGLVTDLPALALMDRQGHPTMKGPVEVPLDDIQEAELADCGFNCLVQWQGTDMAVFFAAPTCGRPRQSQDAAATSAARLATRLTYVLAVSRFAHYMKALLRDKFEAPRSRNECERVLNDWIGQYVVEDDSSSMEVKARCPLHNARIEVDCTPGAPGRFRATAFLHPHFQLEGVALRVVVDLPAPVR
jgi:type VI secretion system protein ImpC